MLIFLSGLAAAALAAWLACRLPLKKQNLLLNLLAVLFPLSEIWKQLLLTWANGGVYRWWYFPFQLCSMPLYLLPLRQLLALCLLQSHALRLRQSLALRLRRVPLLSWLSSVLTDFLADFGLLAGLFAFADQTGMRYPLPALTLHSYLWHFAMIFLGLFLILSGRHSRSSSAARQGSAYAPGQPLSRSRRAAHENGGEKVRKSSGFLPAAILFLILAGIAELLNFLLRSKGSIDMFYISPWEPSTQVVLRDIAARLGRGPEILLYLGLILLGAGLIHLCAAAFRRS